MQVSVEISKYPLAQVDYVTAIKDFIDRINQYELDIITNNMSTQIFGDYDKVMHALNIELKHSFEKHETTVFVCKFIAGNLKQKYSQ